VPSRGAACRASWGSPGERLSVAGAPEPRDVGRDPGRRGRGAGRDVARQAQEGVRTVLP